ncbi:ComF family protein [Polynucleobacter nymphae]|uniref:ComF family protein n=1 Tax=Polynucleobacter nymphae TaxID=2081043 RepID=UPI001C0CF641|nr:ComF family protein [Polynucleobacter nymphae]MBU3608283.1 ComF family protein [Polynucleobacter nymphae]
MRFLDQFFQSLRRQILPSACIVCERFQQDSICTDCLQSLDADSLLNYECCYQCGITLNTLELAKQRCKQCSIHPPYFDVTYCLDRYEGALQHAIHQLKYQKRLAYAHGLANAWNHIFSIQLKNVLANYLLPVPLSTQKLSARGFNQSWEIARRITCNPSIQKLPWALKRHHHEFQQVGGRLAARHLAIQGVFYIDDHFIDLLGDQSIIIFDDVMTSGATLNEIARILKDNGASHVTNWVLLRTAKAPHV